MPKAHLISPEIPLSHENKLEGCISCVIRDQKNVKIRDKWKYERYRLEKCIQHIEKKHLFIILCVGRSNFMFVLIFLFLKITVFTIFLHPPSQNLD